MANAPMLTLRRDDAIAWLEICNAARMNAMTAAMWRQLPDLLQQADNDPEIRVIILRGEGDRAFCAGADISEFGSARTGESARDYDQLNHNAFLALTSAAKPTVAMIHGFCLGGGLGLAACCDLRLGDDKAQFAIPAARLGIGYNPRWVTPLLALTSPANVKEILFTGRRLNADEALRFGLINRSVPATDLVHDTVALATAIAANAPLSIHASKLAVNELVDHPENPNLYKLDEAVQRCFDSEDYQEGQRGFLEKRKPVFKGG